jgi:hypothetical protein
MVYSLSRTRISIGATTVEGQRIVLEDVPYNRTNTTMCEFGWLTTARNESVRGLILSARTAIVHTHRSDSQRCISLGSTAQGTITERQNYRHTKV